MNKTADTILKNYAEDYAWSKRTRINKPSDFTKQARQDLMNDILALIGEDEELPKQEYQGQNISAPIEPYIRNQLRAELRQKIRQYFGQDNQGGKT